MNEVRSQEEWQIVDGLNVRCRVVRNSTADLNLSLPLILLHGLGCSAETWNPTLTCLGKSECRFSHIMIAPDFPGYGCSDDAPHVLGIPELADWTVHLMDTLGIARAHFAGNSMGCQVALSLARRYPDRTGKLALVGPTIGDHRVPFLRYFVGLILDGFCEPLRYNWVLTRMYAQMGLRRYLATVKKMMEEDSLSYANQISAPGLVLRGRRDKVIPLLAAQELAETMPQGQFRLMPHAAHALQFSNPQEFTQILTDFLDAEQGEIRTNPAASEAALAFSHPPR